MFFYVLELSIQGDNQLQSYYILTVISYKVINFR